MRNLFSCGTLIIAAVASPCNARSLPQPDGSLRIVLVAGRPVVDGVFLNGQGPWRFLLDTGAQTNQVEASIARKLGLLPAFRTAIATTAGDALVTGNYLLDSGSPRRVDPCGGRPRRRPGRPASRRTGRPPRS